RRSWFTPKAKAQASRRSIRRKQSLQCWRNTKSVAISFSDSIGASGRQVRQPKRSDYFLPRKNTSYVRRTAIVPKRRNSASCKRSQIYRKPLHWLSHTKRHSRFEMTSDFFKPCERFWPKTDQTGYDHRKI